MLQICARSDNLTTCLNGSTYICLYLCSKGASLLVFHIIFMHVTIPHKCELLSFVQVYLSKRKSWRWNHLIFDFEVKVMFFYVHGIRNAKLTVNNGEYDDYIEW